MTHLQVHPRRVAFTLGLALSVTALIGLASLFAFSTNAAFTAQSGDKYTFSLRGIISSIDLTKNNLKLEVTNYSSNAKTDTAGKTIDIRFADAKIYTMDGTTQLGLAAKNLKSGQEVSVVGVKRKSGRFDASSMTRTDRRFTVVGKLEEINKDNSTVTIKINTSTYKPAGYVGKKIIMNYTKDTAFIQSGYDVGVSGIEATVQRVKVIGNINDAKPKWFITKLWDKY